MHTKNIKMHNFIFSNKLLYRVPRHIVFWLARILFLSANDCIYKYDTSQSFLANYSIAAKEYLPLTIIEAAYCYTIIYFLVPKYLQQKKYIVFIACVLLATLFIRFISLYYNILFLWGSGITSDAIPVVIWNGTVKFLYTGPPATCALLLSIKMFKAWHIKEKEKEALLYANAAAEILLLKAQVHPHFLFNTLNNIYSFALDKSPKAGEMVQQLGDMMEYMINDCETELVTLDKELKMLSDYIGLEKVRYGNRLHVQIAIAGGDKNKLVTPLLMIPFVENSFKHGTSQMLDNPWIKLSVQADEEVLHFILTNSKPAHIAVNGKSGIGLSNVKKRLALLYPSNHLLTVESTINTFTVNMQVPLFEMHAEATTITQPVLA